MDNGKMTAPPSAPVGVEGIIATDEAAWALAARAEAAGAERDSDDNGTWWTLRIEQFKALAQQPAPIAPYCPRCDSNREVLANEADEADATCVPCPDCRPSAPVGVDKPLPVFSAGAWTYSETGQAFSAADLDQAAFVAYRDHLAQQPAARPPAGVEVMDRAMDAYRAACAEWRKNPDNRDEPEAMFGVRAVVEALAQQPAAEYKRQQPCGCVLCVCEDEKQCHGCGAKHCGNRTDHPAYVAQQPAAVDGADR